METIEVVFYHAKKLTRTMFRAGKKKAEVSNTYPRYKKNLTQAILAPGTKKVTFSNFGRGEKMTGK